MFRYVREKRKREVLELLRENMKGKGLHYKLNLATNLENHRGVSTLIRKVQKDTMGCHGLSDSPTVIQERKWSHWPVQED